jgi:DNA-directed RNA polymerase subunit L
MKKTQENTPSTIPKIQNIKEENGTLTFTISDTDVSYVNAIRRTLISDIPVVVFKTLPYSENKCKIFLNTSRLHNEVIKQRLSCIPICITDLNMNILKNLLLEVDVENTTDTCMYVTTGDFKIKDVTTNKYLEKNIVKKIFPPFVCPNGTEYYIDFLRLRPKLTDTIPGERIKLTCEFSIDTAKKDGAFNVTGTCALNGTTDVAKMEEQLEIIKQQWKDEGKTEKEIKFAAANWKLLDGKRYVIKDSFDFIIKTIGIYDNDKLIINACDILVERLKKLRDGELKIDKITDTTLPNCYTILLPNEDYTIGNMLNHELYSKFYKDLKILNFTSFSKEHPHDTDGILKISFEDTTFGVSKVTALMKAVINESINMLYGIKNKF